MHSSNDNASKRPNPGAAILFALLGSAIVGLVVTAFVWTAATSEPKDLPVGINGPVPAVSALERSLSDQSPAPLDTVLVDSRADAVERIRSRELYGAILLGDQPEVLIASAAGSAPAQALRGIATQLQGEADDQAVGALTEQLSAIAAAVQAGQAPPLPEAGAEAPAAPTVKVTDVVPLAAGDPSGAGLAVSVFPIVLGGMIGGVLVALRMRGGFVRLLGLLVFGAGAAAAIVGVLQFWFGMLEGDWLMNGAVIALGVTATAAFVGGFGALMGPAGLVLAGIVTLLFAMPISGAALPPEFLLEPFGEVGQWFVPGAAMSLLRSVAYFPEAPTMTQWVVLGAWAGGGALLALVGRYPFRARATEPEAVTQSLFAY